MARFNFKKEFHPQILKGLKLQTIRPLRKKLPRAGEEMSVWGGSRYQPFKLGEAIVDKVALVTVTDDAVNLFWHDEAGNPNGETLMRPGAHLDMFAVRDGFPNFADMVKWFRKIHPDAIDDAGALCFNGFLTMWKGFRPAEVKS